MITVINKANKGLYNQLFDQVQNWLYTHDADGQEVEAYSENALLGKTLNERTGEEEPEILTSLEELFMFMRQITRFAPIYTRLPLDEEPFFIDADTRAISVPKSFATNGVSVQGDEISEILFFKVNRFFDATDLSRCQIFIQWKSVDENGNPKEGVSRPWIQDIESEPGYLIFGWPISSKITKVAGNITFSVRFYRLDQADKLIYSFSTLDQTVKIQPALDYDIEDIANETSQVVVDNMASTIELRAISSPASSGITVAEAPYWEEGIVNGLKGWTTELKADGSVKYQVMNLGLDNQFFSVVPVQLVTAALSDDSGIVSYTWTKVDKNGEGDLYLSDGETRFYQPIAYRVVDTLEENRLTHKTYYWKDGDKYKAIPSTTSLDTIRDEQGAVYELVSIATLDEVGKYVAMAENRVGKSFSEPLIADTIYVPMPVEPELGDLEASSTPILNGTDPVTLGLEVVLKDEFGNDVGEVIDNETGATRGGKATFVWKRRGLDEQVPTVVEGMDEAELILTNPVEDEGWYSVTVTNNLNKETASADSNEVRITKPANKLTVSLSNAEVDDISLVVAQEGLGVVVSGVEDYREAEDDITYQWYKYRQGDHDIEVDKAAAKAGTYQINQDVKIEDLNALGDVLTEAVLLSSKTDTLIPPVAGFYFCEVTNHYNGSETKSLSPFYNVQDA
jgi:hypothetical protein